MSLETHPWTSIFALSDGTRLTELAEDIRRYGQHEPIMLYEGKILDGRNRYRACVLIGIEPRVVNYEDQQQLAPALYPDSPLDWMVRKNLAERNLSKSQLGALAVDVLNLRAGGMYEGGRYEPGTKTVRREIREAAELVGVGPSSVDRLAAIQKRNPALLEAVRAGYSSVAQASRDAGFAEYGDAPIPGAYELFGKGDKFRESTEPLMRYLNAWRGRDFEFRHVSPKEATQRLKTIDRLLEGLTEARADLADRALKAKLRH